MGSWVPGEPRDHIHGTSPARTEASFWESRTSPPLVTSEALPSTLTPLPSTLTPLPSTLTPLPSTLTPLPSTLTPFWESRTSPPLVTGATRRTVYPLYVLYTLMSTWSVVSVEALWSSSLDQTNSHAPPGTRPVAPPGTPPRTTWHPLRRLPPPPELAEILLEILPDLVEATVHPRRPLALIPYAHPYCHATYPRTGRMPVSSPPVLANPPYCHPAEL
eukprot:1180978-Prorocentrum_minimum.AAC.2